jgi:hypothetical protein
MNEPGSSEGGDALDMGWEIGFTTVTGGLNYMLYPLAIGLQSTLWAYLWMQHTCLRLAIVYTV